MHCITSVCIQPKLTVITVERLHPSHPFTGLTIPVVLDRVADGKDLIAGTPVHIKRL